MREDTEVQPVTDDIGRQQVTAELQSSIVVAPMFCAHIAPIAADVPAYVGKWVEQILSDQGVDTAGDGQATEGKSWLKAEEGGHGDAQFLHGDGASYSSKVERSDGEVAVTITHVMALLVGSAGVLWLGRTVPWGAGSWRRVQPRRYFIVG
ncbi:hypothetical protein A7K61_23495 [Pseudomonas sp. AP42]|nr:hypothetical protein A7K61_23495 [Pseudomonas sp. AP42]